jgi:hypothetical protein
MSTMELVTPLEPSPVREKDAPSSARRPRARRCVLTPWVPPRIGGSQHARPAAASQRGRAQRVKRIGTLVRGGRRRGRRRDGLAGEPGARP